LLTTSFRDRHEMAAHVDAGALQALDRALALYEAKGNKAGAAIALQARA
jgi:hypothetical protein